MTPQRKPWAKTNSPMSRDDLHTKRWSPSRVDLPVLPRESPSGKIQTRYFQPWREISETNNSCSCSCSNSCSNLSHSWCMGEQLSYIHCWGVPQGSRSRPPASTGTLRYTPPVNVGNCTYQCVTISQRTRFSRWLDWALHRGMLFSAEKVNVCISRQGKHPPYPPGALW